MRRRRKAERPSEGTGELLTFELEREDDPVVAPPAEREPVRKPFVVPFEALPAKTIVSRW
jgi:hypothetical protein